MAEIEPIDLKRGKSVNIVAPASPKDCFSMLFAIIYLFVVKSV